MNASFTRQLRGGQGAFSRENLENADLPQLPPEQVEPALAETDTVVAEVETEVPAAVAELDEGTDAITEVEGDADTLEATAQILEDAIAAEPVTDPANPEAEPTPGEIPADVEPAGAEIADLAIEAIANKYNIARPARISAESFASGSARVATYAALSKEAFEGAKELRARAVEGIKKLIEWFKNLIKSVFDKRTQLEKRIAALTSSANSLSGEVAADAKIKVGGWGAVVGDAVAADPAPALKELVSFVNEFGQIAKIGGKTIAETGDVAEVDLNPKKLAGMTLKFSATGGKYSVTKEQTGKPEAMEVAPLNSASIKAVLRDAHKALKSLTMAEANFEVLIKDMEGAYGTLKSAVTGKEGGEKVDRSAVIARYQAFSKLSGSVSAVALAVIGNAVSVVEKSMAAHKAPAAAPAAAAA